MAQPQFNSALLVYHRHAVVVPVVHVEHKDRDPSQN